jgi:hypothetical protein
MNKPIELRATFEEHEKGIKWSSAHSAQPCEKPKKVIKAKVVVLDSGAYPKEEIFTMKHRDPRMKVSILSGKGDLALTFNFFDDPKAADRWVNDIVDEVYKQYEEWYASNCTLPCRHTYVVTPHEDSMAHDEELLLAADYEQAEDGIGVTVTCTDQGPLSRIRIFRSLSKAVDVINGDTKAISKVYDTVPEAKEWAQRIVDETKEQYRKWYKGTALDLPGDRRIEIRPKGNVKYISHYQHGTVTEQLKQEEAKEHRPKLSARHIRRYIKDMYGDNVRVQHIIFDGTATPEGFGTVPCSARITIKPSKCAPRGLVCEGTVYPDLRVVYRWAFPDQEISDDVDPKDLVHYDEKVVYCNDMKEEK